nr:hypothetical protein [Paracoccus saliphilus]
MSIYHVNKSLLLDGRHFSRPLGGNLGLVAKNYEAECADRLQCEANILGDQFLAFTSDRLDRTCFSQDPDIRPGFLARGWWPNLPRICKEVGPLSEAGREAWRIRDKLSAYRFHERIIQHLSHWNYDRATSLSRLLDESWESELPCFTRKEHLDPAFGDKSSISTAGPRCRTIASCLRSRRTGNERSRSSSDFVRAW